MVNENMFLNYDNVPVNYYPGMCQAPQAIKCCGEPKLPLEVFNCKGKFVGYKWNQNETINLSFYSEGEVTYDDGSSEDMNTYFNGKKVTLNIYDFRYDIVYTNTITYVAIDDNKSTTPIPAICNFEYTPDWNIPKGVYRCSLTLEDSKQEEKEGEEVTTLISSLDLIKVEDYTLTIN